jgi:hypothetical protein
MVRLTMSYGLCAYGAKNKSRFLRRDEETGLCFKGKENVERPAGLAGGIAYR